MKKILKNVLLFALVACLLIGAVGCGSIGWKKEDVTVSLPNEIITSSNGGFVAESDNNIYVINGLGSSTNSNKFGEPIKGSLIAIDKTDYSNKCIVVPKLFVASDYSSGLFLDGQYVYYGTPSTEKNAQGTIANNELVFCRTKLDGTDTKEFFTIKSLSSQYRFSKVGNDVFITYYDNNEAGLCCYNTTTGEKDVIVKTSKLNKTETLSSYHFADTESANGVVLFYSTKTFSEDYNEEKENALGDSYERGKYSYNKIYAYKPGDTNVNEDCKGKLLLDGSASSLTPCTYEVSYFKNGYLFFTKKDSTSVIGTKFYGVNAVDFYEGTAEPTYITRGSVTTDLLLVKSLSEVYIFEDNAVVKTAYEGDVTFVEERVVLSTTITKLLFVESFVEGEGAEQVTKTYLYYVNADNKLCRVLFGEDGYEEKVSEDIVSTTWYAPEIADGKIFYLDSSSLGLSYVKYVSLSSIATEEDTNDDDIIDSRYLEGQQFAGVLTNEDMAKFVTKKLNQLSNELKNGKIVFDDVDGELQTVKAVVKARELYESLTNEQKSLVERSALKLLIKYEKAIEVSNILKPLVDFDKVEITDENREEYRGYWQAAKTALEGLKTSTDYTANEVRNLLVENYGWFYDQATKVFGETQN
ncbi:MAG: hypothetical protein IKW33_03755 [Clostridia bacterium]|nr:hypothetical protein [Clostridia bacterium]